MVIYMAKAILAISKLKLAILVLFPFFFVVEKSVKN
jgi:hypothetical protein